MSTSATASAPGAEAGSAPGAAAPGGAAPRPRLAVESPCAVWITVIEGRRSTTRSISTRPRSAGRTATRTSRLSAERKGSEEKAGSSATRRPATRSASPRRSEIPTSENWTLRPRASAAWRAIASRFASTKASRLYTARPRPIASTTATAASAISQRRMVSPAEGWGWARSARGCLSSSGPPRHLIEGHDLGPRRLDLPLGQHEAPEDHAEGAPLGVEPVGDARVAVRDHELEGAVRPLLCLLPVQGDAPVRIVVGLHVAVPEVDVRAAAARPARAHAQRLLRTEQVGRHRVGGVGRGEAHVAGLRRLRELVRRRGDEGRLLALAGRRLFERARADEGRHAPQAGGDRGVARRGGRRSSTLDLDRERQVPRRVGGRAALLLEVVARREARRVGRERDPVARP